MCQNCSRPNINYLYKYNSFYETKNGSYAAARLPDTGKNFISNFLAFNCHSLQIQCHCFYYYLVLIRSVILGCQCRPFSVNPQDCPIWVNHTSQQEVSPRKSVTLLYVYANEYTIYSGSVIRLGNYVVLLYSSVFML